LAIGDGGLNECFFIIASANIVIVFINTNFCYCFFEPSFND